jgi:hypothetical protein
MKENERKTTVNLLKSVDLEELGSSIRHLPRAQWEERMFFFNALDKQVRLETHGIFPHHIKSATSAHPIFVLKTLGNLAHEVCPCSSKCFSEGMRYIAKGCKLEVTGWIMDRNSYLVEELVFTMPQDHTFRRNLKFKGRVPRTCLREEI